MSTTFVTGTIVDGQGTVLANSWVSAWFLPGAPGSNVNGVPVPTTAGPVQAGPNGVFQLNVTDNSSITPAGSSWRWQFCPPPTAPQCFRFVVPVSGISQDITSYIQIPPLVVKSISLPPAYYSYEIAEPVTGSVYWDLTLGFAQVYNGSSWIPLVGGAVGGPGSNFVDGEVVFGSGNSWSLARIPVPSASLQLFQNLPSFGSILLRSGVDYNAFGQSIVTINSIAAGSLMAWYRY